jgi:uncharacterized membrane protein YeaQ/YmgE (transglycosylase-associated protein family)
MKIRKWITKKRAILAQRKLALPHRSTHRTPPPVLRHAKSAMQIFAISPHVAAFSVRVQSHLISEGAAMEIFGSTHGVIMTIIIGLIVGLVAKFLKPGRDPSGFIITALIGIAGSFLATFIGKSLDWYQPGQTAGFIGSVIGAIILLILYGLITRNR